MLKILWKRGEIAPQEQFLLFSTIFCNLILDFYAKTRTRFSLRDKRLFEITEVEITRVNCKWFLLPVFPPLLYKVGPPLTGTTNSLVTYKLVKKKKKRKKKQVNIINFR